MAHGNVSVRARSTFPVRALHPVRGLVALSRACRRLAAGRRSPAAPARPRLAPPCPVPAPHRRPALAKPIALALGPALFAASLAPAAAAVRLEIAGLPEALEENVRAYVGRAPRG